MHDEKIYCSYNDYHIVYDSKEHSFDAYYKKEQFIKSARLTKLCREDGKPFTLSDFARSTVNRIGVWNESCHFIYEEFSNGESDSPYLTLKVNVSDMGVRVDLICDDPISATLTGEILCGEYADLFPVCLERGENDLRASVGKAPTQVDHAVYNRKLDTAVSVGISGQTKLKFKMSGQRYATLKPYSRALRKTALPN